MSRPSSDSPRQPLGLAQRAWNLAESLAAFIADGLQTVTKEQYQQRLEICDQCDRREGGMCLECGCLLAIKARIRVSHCPLEKWPSV
jgi:hypothetical protein